MMEFNFDIKSTAPISKFFQSLEISSLQEALNYVKHLAYGRTSNRNDLSSVLQEGRGTCSSKHALLKYLADENGHDYIKLVMIIYAMNGVNTPGVGAVLQRANLHAIPEAHCALQIGNEFLDVTTAQSHPALWINDVLDARSISVDDISQKEAWHRSYLLTWLKQKNLDLSLSNLWAIREACIAALSS